LTGNFFKKLFGKKPASQKKSEPPPWRPSDLIVAAKVISADKHPNADRLRIVSLDVGGGKIIKPVVCGAFNFGAGDMVVLALPGAKIAQNIHTQDHQPFNLDKATIRGIESQGMICAAFELGIGPLSDKPEIMVLKNSAVPGSQFKPQMLQ
jgi:phenylalanyl-tRNA synthetase beta chain